MFIVSLPRSPVNSSANSSANFFAAPRRALLAAAAEAILPLMKTPQILVDGQPWRRGMSVLTADGAWGSELFRLGLEPGEAPEAWNADRPDRVAEVAAAYYRAGSRVVETNSFGGNRLQLSRHDLGERTAELNRRAAEITAEAVGPHGVAAGSIGPSGAMLVTGEVTEQQLHEVFSEQARALADGGAQWIAVETMSDLREMAVSVAAAWAATGLPVSASMTYEPTTNGFRTMMGHDPASCVHEAEDAGAAIIGANCGTGIDYYAALVRTLRELTDLPLWVYPNAGAPVLVEGKLRYPLGPEDFARDATGLVAAGADIIGGCCGTTPAHIRAVAAALA